MSRPTSIAVGYDGSDGSDAAVGWSAALAAAVGAELRLVHAVGILEHAGLISAQGLEETAVRIASDCGVPLSRLRWRAVEGEPVAVLCQEVETGADLLVVGTRGAGAHPGVLLGSTSMALVERAPVPVVVVPVR